MISLVDLSIYATYRDAKMLCLYCTTLSTIADGISNILSSEAIDMFALKKVQM